MAYQQPLSEKEGLRLIQEMIRIAKQEQKDDGKGWIVWGWLLFLASLCSVFNIVMHWNLFPYDFWIAFAILSTAYIIYVLWQHNFRKKKAEVKTYSGDILQMLNTGFVVSMLLVNTAINLNILPVNTGFIMLINLYAFRILIQGSVLNFRAFIIGAIICWAMALAGVFLKSFVAIMVVHAISALFGFIIPGHLVNQDFNKSKFMFNKVNPLRV